MWPSIGANLQYAGCAPDSLGTAQRWRMERSGDRGAKGAIGSSARWRHRGTEPGHGALRDHLSAGHAALVLVVRWCSDVAMGGLVAGVVAVAAGFIAYDLFLIPALLLPDRRGSTMGAPSASTGRHAGRGTRGGVPAGRPSRGRPSRGRHPAGCLPCRTKLNQDRPVAGGSLELVVTTIERSFAPTWVALLLPTDPEGANLAVAGPRRRDHPR